MTENPFGNEIRKAIFENAHKFPLAGWNFTARAGKIQLLCKIPKSTEREMWEAALDAGRINNKAAQNKYSRHYIYTRESTYLSAAASERGWCEPKNWLNFTSMLTTPLPAALSNVREIKHARASRIEIWGARVHSLSLSIFQLRGEYPIALLLLGWSPISVIGAFSQQKLFCLSVSH